MTQISLAKISLIIDGKTLRVSPGTTLLEGAKQAGLYIPTLCYSPSCQAGGSCMVCAVLDTKTHQMLPSCEALCQPGMVIESESLEVRDFRRTALELLLREHRGACEALCSSVCPQILPIPQWMGFLARGEKIPRFFFDPAICESCGGKCERACRRGRYDQGMSIREVLKKIPSPSLAQHKRSKGSPQYNHLFGRVTQEELKDMADHADLIKGTSNLQQETARCLQCACSAKDQCQLRHLATVYQAKQARVKREKPQKFQLIPAGKILFEPGKCVHCGRCVQLGKKLKPGRGPVLAYRSIQTRITPPFGMTYQELFGPFEKEFARECPTGALSLREERD